MVRQVVATAKGTVVAFVAVPLLQISFAEAQTYTGGPDYTINDTQTAYDGIGDVIPLPGGTSVLERVLYTVDQLNLSAPGSVAQINGVYANIAESVMNREWYSTDRTEVAYENYTQDVTTTNGGLTYATFVNGPDAGDISSINVGGTATTLDLGAIEFARSSVYLVGVDPSNEYYGIVQFMGDVGLGDDVGYVDLTLDSLPDVGSSLNLFKNNTGSLQVELNSDGSIDLNEDASNIALIGLLEFADGSVVFFDTMSDAEESALIAFNGTSVFTPLDETPIGWMPSDEIAAGIIPASIDIAQDVVGDMSGDVSFSTVSVLSDYVLVYVDGAAKLVSQSYAEENELLDSITYDVTEYDVPFTRQLDYFYEDWNQRELATLIDGSITNTINGVTAATAIAVTETATATDIVLPTIDLGDIATTALGAVNTGDIIVGVSSAVDDAAGSTTRAIQASLTVVGGAAEAGTMMLNISHNTSSTRGNVENTLNQVNGSVGDISTTALGAVNTGTIVSGVHVAVQGIVGMSGQSSF